MKLVKILGKGGNDIGKKVFSNIKNVMSDKCEVQRKFNNFFITLRKEYLPDVVRNWSNLSNVEQESFGKVNEFFCGLHFLVGLADQAEACLKVWENILYNGQNIGSLAHRGYSNGESGTLRLIRSVRKSVHYRGCEKSGKMVTFEILWRSRISAVFLYTSYSETALILSFLMVQAFIIYLII